MSLKDSYKYIKYFPNITFPCDLLLLLPQGSWSRMWEEVISGALEKRGGVHSPTSPLRHDPLSAITCKGRRESVKEHLSVGYYSLITQDKKAWHWVFAQQIMSFLFTKGRAYSTVSKLKLVFQNWKQTGQMCLGEIYIHIFGESANRSAKTSNQPFLCRTRLHHTYTSHTE